MGTTIAILGIGIPLLALCVPLTTSLINSLIDSRTKSNFVIIKAQIAQLQNRIAIMQAKLGEEVDTFIREES